MNIKEILSSFLKKIKKFFSNHYEAIFAVIAFAIVAPGIFFYPIIKIHEHFKSIPRVTTVKYQMIEYEGNKYPKYNRKNSKEIIKTFNIRHPRVLNVNTGVYHKKNCKWAKKCTRNCILVEKKVAVFYGRPCKHCH